MILNRIAVPASAHEIDLDNGMTPDGTIIHLWEHHYGGQELWRFEKGEKFRLLSYNQWNLNFYIA